MATIDSLTLEVTAETTKAISSLNRVSSALKNLKDSLPTQQKLEGTAKGFKALTDQISSLSLSNRNLTQIKTIGTIAKNISKLSAASPSNIKKIAEDRKSVV